MDTKALQLASRFSLPPNSLGYCGKESAPEKFKKCIIHEKCHGVEKEITKFIVLHPYLKTISQITKLPIYSYEVIEAYWLGNDLLKKFKPKHYDLLLENFAKQGVPDFFIEELKLKPPKIFIPNHLFQVLHVGVGKASGSVPFNLESINNCMIRWGKVEKIIKNRITISLNSLKQNRHTTTYSSSERSESRSSLKNKVSSRQARTIKGYVAYQLTKTMETIPFDPQIVNILKIGDTVAAHWNMVVKKLTKEEEQNFSFWTNKVINSIC